MTSRAAAAGDLAERGGGAVEAGDRARRERRPSGPRCSRSSSWQPRYVVCSRVASRALCTEVHLQASGWTARRRSRRWTGRPQSRRRSSPNPCIRMTLVAVLPSPLPPLGGPSISPQRWRTRWQSRSYSSGTPFDEAQRLRPPRSCHGPLDRSARVAPRRPARIRGGGSSSRSSSCFSGTGTCRRARTAAPGQASSPGSSVPLSRPGSSPACSPGRGAPNAPPSSSVCSRWSAPVFWSGLPRARRRGAAALNRADDPGRAARVLTVLAVAAAVLALAVTVAQAHWS